MNILLFHPKKETLEMLSFCLESQMSLKVSRAQTFQQVVEQFLEEEPIDLVVTSLQPETDKLFKYILSTGGSVPVILVAENEEEKVEAYPDIRVLGKISQKHVPDKLFTLIRDSFPERTSTPANEEYCRINTELLVRVVPLRGDIYIRLSSVKYVKLFRRGMIFSSQDLERFLQRKKISYLYIKKADSLEFMDKFQETLKGILETAVPEDGELFETVSEVQDLLQDLSTTLGFNSEVQELARTNVKLTIKAIGASPRLTKVLGASPLRNKNYISSHSVQLANIACCIAAQMEWPSNTTFQKLVMAALFHDFLIPKPELAKVATKKELDALHLKPNDEQFLIIKNHMIKASELIKTLSEVPSDVDVIVLQHHERPDGTGFPKGIRAHQIAPLAAVFIMAHDVLHAMRSSEDKFDFKRFLRNSEAEYQGSGFRKVWKALSQEIEGGGRSAA